MQNRLRDSTSCCHNYYSDRAAIFGNTNRQDALGFSRESLRCTAPCDKVSLYYIHACIYSSCLYRDPSQSISWLGKDHGIAGATKLTNVFEPDRTPSPFYPIVSTKITNQPVFVLSCFCSCGISLYPSRL